MPDELDHITEPPSFYDSDVFKEYRAQIEAFMFRFRKGITTADIHRKLGRDHMDWTLSAIAMIDDVEVISICPTRWRKLPPAKRLKPPVDTHDPDYYKNYYQRNREKKLAASNARNKRMRERVANCTS